jgi:hypothetical protein
MTSWADFERLAPEFAEAAHRLLIGSDGVAIAFLATVTRANHPRLAPVCPIFRLVVERVLWVHWERVGQPDTRAVRRYRVSP